MGHVPGSVAPPAYAGGVSAAACPALGIEGSGGVAAAGAGCCSRPASRSSCSLFSFSAASSASSRAASRCFTALLSRVMRSSFVAAALDCTQHSAFKREHLQDIHSRIQDDTAST